MTGFNTLDPDQLQAWVNQAKATASTGRVVDRIPRLKAVDPNWLAVQVETAQQSYSAGEVDCIFALMSVIKPFLLLYLLEKFGGHAVFNWVGTLPSDRSFNSLSQLVADQGYPRNPMINSGAIVLADRLPGETADDCCASLCEWLNRLADCRLHLDRAMLASVRSVGRGANQDLADCLAQAGYLEDAERALDTYEQICCISGTVNDLARLGLLLAGDRASSYASDRASDRASSGDANFKIQPVHRRTVNALMLTCGLYEASGRFAVQVGLPIKSGISGALLTVVPGAGAIACYSPTLDAIGNPVAGLALVQLIAQTLQLSLF